MFFRHLCSADGISHQSGVLNQLAGKISLRTLECAACTRIIERLLIASALGKVVHLRFDFRRIANFQLHIGGQCHPLRMVFVRTRAVAEGVLFSGQRADGIGLCVIIARGHHDIRHLSAVRTSVHKQRTAQRARDTARKFQTSQAVFQRFIGEHRQQCASLCLHCGSLHVYRAVFRANAQHDAANAFIAHQHIGTVSQNSQRQSRLLCRLYSAADGTLGFRHNQQVCRSADAKRGMSIHRLFGIECQLIRRTFEFFLEFFYHKKHFIPSISKHMISP